MTQWKNVSNEQLIFGEHIAHPGQTIEVDSARDAEVAAIEGFERVGGLMRRSTASGLVGPASAPAPNAESIEIDEDD